jgi:glutaredoxin
MGRIIFGMTLILSLVIPSTGMGDVYKWKDKAGKVHFSDKPPATGSGAEEISGRLRSQSNVLGMGSAAATARAGVTILTASWCGVCKRAKAWLQGHGVPYDEYDVEKSATGRAEYRRLHGTGVPIILVGKQRMNGFQGTRLGAMLQAAGYKL